MARPDTFTNTVEDAAAYERAQAHDPEVDRPDAEDLRSIDADLRAARDRRLRHDERRAAALAAGRWEPKYLDLMEAEAIAGLINLESVAEGGRADVAVATVHRDGVLCVLLHPSSWLTWRDRAAALIRNRGAASDFTGLSYDVRVDGRVVWVLLSRAAPEPAPF